MPPSGSVSEILVVVKSLAFRSLVLFAEATVAGLPATEGVPARQLPELEKVGGPVRGLLSSQRPSQGLPNLNCPSPTTASFSKSSDPYGR